MKRRIFRKSKRGISLVEEICAVFILAIGVFAVVVAIGMARTSVLSDSTQEAAAAQAQELADNLISELSQKSAVPADISQMGRKSPSAAYRLSMWQTKTVLPIQAKQNSSTSRNCRAADYGYNIVCRAYYNGGKNFVQMKAYASACGLKSP